MSFERVIPKLNYMADSPYAVIPPHEQLLQTVTAEPFFCVDEGFEQLEGLCFDRYGDLYFVGIDSGHIFKLTWETKKCEIIYTTPESWTPAAVKIHKNGRLFIPCLGNFVNSGCIFSMNPDGTDVQMVVPQEAGYVIDDLTFDSKGGFYFTDFKGFTGDNGSFGADAGPRGGVHYVSPDYKTITPVLRNMRVANGVALSPDEKRLWVTEMSAGLLHIADLNDDGFTSNGCTSIPYHFTGYMGPDSCEIDGDGNLYVALYQQGRYMVFNPLGYPIGQIVMPGREMGHYLRTSHSAIRPGTDELYMTGGDWINGGGSWLFQARAFSNAWMNMYQYQDKDSQSASPIPKVGAPEQLNEIH